MVSEYAGGSGGRGREVVRVVSDISNVLKNEVSKVIIGKQENLLRVTIGNLSTGNMLLEDFPGFARQRLQMARP